MTRNPAALEFLLASLIAGWFALMLTFGGNIYVVLGPYALAVCVTLCALRGRSIRAWFRFTPLAIGTGLGVGAAMTLLTYPIFDLVASLQPALQGRVQGLYTAAHRTTLFEALAWIVPIIVAEELLWRGVLLDALARRFSPAAAMAIGIATYVLAQFGSRSWVVALMAIVCGTIWSLQRHFTQSLVSPLIAHFIWTPMVIFLHPVA